MADFTVCTCHQCGARFPVGRAHTMTDCIAYLKGRQVELDGKLLNAETARGNAVRLLNSANERVRVLREALARISGQGLLAATYEEIAGKTLALDDDACRRDIEAAPVADLAPLFSRAE